MTPGGGTRPQNARPAGRPAARLRVAVVIAAFLTGAVALAQPPEAPGGLRPTARQPGVRLPDGTFLWAGPADPGGERVVLTPQELQKLLDQVEQLKKQLAARKPTPPSSVALRGRVEKRGESVVAAFKAAYSFHTAGPNTAISLGARRAFLVAAALDGNKLPVLDAGEDGFAALVETAGDHTLSLDLEVAVGGRGGKTEVGFELGLPRAAITTLLLDPPADVKRLNLTTRTPDPTQPAKAPEVRRSPGLDPKQLAPRPGAEAGFPLGPVDQVEVTWEPPAAAAAAPAEAVQSADWDVAVVVTEGFVDTTAKVRPRGSAGTWRVVVPLTGELTAERAGPNPAADLGPVQQPTVTKPADPAKPVWKVDLPAGSSAADWVFTVTARVNRAKTGDPKHKGPFPVGPLAVLDVARQTGTLRITAPATTRLAFRPNTPDLRRELVANPADDATAAVFRLASGPTGNAPRFTPLLDLEAHQSDGRIQVRPAYKLRLTEGGWRIRAEVRVTPIGAAVEAVRVDLPAEWKSVEAGPPELVEGSPQDDAKADGPWRPRLIRLAAGHRQPFDLVLDAHLPLAPTAKDAAVPFPRFPGAIEREASVTAAVPEGLEVRGSAREWEGDQPAGWGLPLAPISGADGKTPRVPTAIGGKADFGLARAELSWQPHRPDLTADVRADVTVHDRQAVVAGQMRLRSAEGFARPVRFRGPPGAAGLKTQPPLDPLGPGEWSAQFPADAKEAALAFTYAVPVPAHPPGESGKLAVGLLWPSATTRTDSLVRVWAGTGTTRTIALDGGGWRELPPEPAPDRDSLPVLTLAGAGSDIPLSLELRDAESTGVSAWVERGLVQVWAADDGAATYRARFLLKRWLAGSAEVRLPSPLAGPNPEVLLDGKRVEPVPLPDPGGSDRGFRVPLPEPRPGRAVVLEVRYQLPAGARFGEEARPPRLPSAAFAGPVRWQVTVPPGEVPLVAGPGARVEQRWRWRYGMFGPVAAASADDLDRWFRAGGDPDSGTEDGWHAGAGESAVVRTAGLEAVRVARVPRAGLVVGCSVVLLLLGLAAARLAGSVGGPLVAVVGGLAAVGAFLFPQPTAQAAGAVQPGLVALLVVLLGQAAARWQHRRRRTYLPGFARTLPVLPSTATAPPPSRPSANGPSGAATGSAVGQPAPSGS